MLRRLLSLFAGGTLRVSHRGRTVNFPWGNKGSKKEDVLHWAAFYGDCEHEVLEVTKGHRVTLTYNLYYTSTGVARPIADPHTLPLYNVIGDMLKEDKFMKKGKILKLNLPCTYLTTVSGGYLGFFCNHQYAHSHQSGRRSIPKAFKGVDLAIYSAFSALGLKIGIHPIVGDTMED